MDDIQSEVEGVFKQNSFEGQNSSVETPKAHRSLAQLWGDRLESARINLAPYRDKIAEMRQYARGEQHDDDSNALVRANLIHDHIRRCVYQTYARNPKFSIVPTENIDPAAYRKMRLFGKTCEIVLNRFLDDAGLKRRAKSALRASKTTGIGWVKIYYQTRKEADPLIVNKIRDSEDDIRRLKFLESESENPEEIHNRERQMLEIQQYVDALGKEKDMIVSEGLVIDVVDSNNILLDVSTIRNFDDYQYAPFIAEAIWMSKEEARTRWGKIPAGTKEYSLNKEERYPQKVGVDHKTVDEGRQDLIKVYEIHDRLNKLVHYLPDGASEFLQEPIAPTFVGEQWYPYFPLAQNIVDGQFYPLSDVSLLQELQDEHNSARTRFKEHRDISIPHWVGKREEVTERDGNAIKDATAGEIALIDGISGQPIRNSVDVFAPPPIDPAVYDTSHTERDIEKVVGGGEVTQPKSNRSRTLGEAQLLSQDVQAQTTADTDEVEDWFSKIAKHVLELLLQTLTIEQVTAIAGPESQIQTDESGMPTGEMSDGAVWPANELNRGEIFNLLKLQIQAGSSGKPNKEKETQIWTQYVLPKMTELINTVAQLREAKQDDLSEALIRLAQETLRRLDERFDVEEFLPRKQQAPPTPQEMAQMQQAQEAQQLQIEELKADIEETKSKTVKNLAQAEKFSEEADRDNFRDSLDSFKARTDADMREKEMMQQAMLQRQQQQQQQTSKN